MIVNGGKKWYREFTAGVDDWSDPTYTGKRYMGAGISTDTNGGVIGPTVAVSVGTSGFWQGPANSDFKLSDEQTDDRPECSFSIGSNGTVHVQAQFTDANFPASDTYELHEFGIFLHPTSIPGNSPVDFPTTANKQAAMVARTVSFYLDSPDYKTWAYTKVVPGPPLIINFDLIDFGA